MQVSSVMGMTVAVELLLAIYPISASLDAVSHDLKALQASRFLVPGESTSTWAFAQVSLH